MSAFKRLNRSDVFVLPYTANKNWAFDSSSLNPNNIGIYSGYNASGSFCPDTETTSYDAYQSLIFDMVNHLYYQQFSGSFLNDAPLLSSNYYVSASAIRPSGSYVQYSDYPDTSTFFPTNIISQITVLSIPQNIFSNKVKPGTFNIKSQFYNVIDDAKGNLVDIFFADYHRAIGNIFYSHGIAVITNPQFVNMFTDDFRNHGDFNSSYSDSFFIS